MPNDLAKDDSHDGREVEEADLLRPEPVHGLKKDGQGRVDTYNPSECLEKTKSIAGVLEGRKTHLQPGDNTHIKNKGENSRTYQKVVQARKQNGRFHDGANRPHPRLEEGIPPASRPPLRDPQQARDTVAAIRLFGGRDPAVVVRLLDEEYG